MCLKMSLEKVQRICRMDKRHWSLFSTYWRYTNKMIIIIIIIITRADCSIPMLQQFQMLYCLYCAAVPFRNCSLGLCYPSNLLLETSASALVRLEYSPRVFNVFSKLIPHRWGTLTFCTSVRHFTRISLRHLWRQYHAFGTFGCLFCD